MNTEPKWLSSSVICKSGQHNHWCAHYMSDLFGGKSLKNVVKMNTMVSLIICSMIIKKASLNIFIKLFELLSTHSHIINLMTIDK